MSLSCQPPLLPDFPIENGVRIYYNKERKIGRIDVASELALGAIPKRLEVQGQKRSFSLPSEDITRAIPASIKYNVFGVKDKELKESKARYEELALARKNERRTQLTSLQKAAKKEMFVKKPQEEPFHEKIKNSPDGKTFYTLTSTDLTIKHPNGFSEHINLKSKREPPKPPELIIRFLGENPYSGLSPRSEFKSKFKPEIEPINKKGCCVIL